MQIERDRLRKDFQLYFRRVAQDQAKSIQDYISQYFKPNHDGRQKSSGMLLLNKTLAHPARLRLGRLEEEHKRFVEQAKNLFSDDDADAYDPHGQNFKTLRAEGEQFRKHAEALLHADASVKTTTKPRRHPFQLTVSKVDVVERTASELPSQFEVASSTVASQLEHLRDENRKLRQSLEFSKNSQKRINHGGVREYLQSSQQEAALLANGLISKRIGGVGTYVNLLDAGRMEVLAPFQFRDSSVPQKCNYDAFLSLCTALRTQMISFSKCL